MRGEERSEVGIESSPLTINRAATAVVRSRIHLERAEEELSLALRILTERSVDPSLDPPERLALMQRLERYVGRLRELQTMSRTVWEHDRSWWAQGPGVGEGVPPAV